MSLNPEIDPANGESSPHKASPCCHDKYTTTLLKLAEENVRDDTSPAQ
jgi:hypothetical protein